MSQETHPNLHAVGLAVDIIEAIQHRTRGEAAASFTQGELIAITQDEVVNFIACVSTILDEAVSKER